MDTLKRKSRLIVFVTAICFITNSTQSKNQILHFPGTRYSVAEAEVIPWHFNTNITRCVWVKINYNSRLLHDSDFYPFPLMEYSVFHGEIKDVKFISRMYYDRDSQQTFFSSYVHQKGCSTVKYGLCRPISWIHYCSVDVDVVGDYPKIFVNGEELRCSVKFHTPVSHDFGDGCESKPKIYIVHRDEEFPSFSGHLYQLNAWNRSLSKKEISDLANCKSDLEGNLLSWSQFLNGLILQHVTIVDDEGPCTWLDPIDRTKLKAIPVDNGESAEVDCPEKK